MEFFNQAVTVLQTLVIALGAGLGIWGVINLLEGYGNDNPSSLWLIRCNKSGERKSTIQTETTVWSRNIVETQDFCYNGCRTLDDGKRDGKPMNISYQPLWNTLKERGMRKEDLRLAAGLTTNMIANMGKGEHISMKTLLRICEALNCGILDVIELTQDEEN